MEKKFLKNIDWSILISSVILLVIGLIALFSASSSDDYDEFRKQLIFIIASIPILIFTIIINYKTFIKLSMIMYIIIIGLLVGVLFTPEINGATSWYSIGTLHYNHQNLLKLQLYFFLIYGMSISKRIKNEINKWWKLGILLVIVAIPILLILKQPDYGTAMAFVVCYNSHFVL